jgi:SAM-dependent methyltransferase
MRLYQRILGHPFVYERVRPLVVGGIDWSPLYQRLGAVAGDVILDVGCGTGIALDYVHEFSKYVGYDTDPVAIDFARKRHGGPDVTYVCAEVTADQIVRIQPTRIVLAGLLHHITDDECVSLLAMCRAAPSVKRIVTSDPVYLPRARVSNLLAHLDRGRFVRTPGQYRELIARAGLRRASDDVVRSHPGTGIAFYFMTVLEPAPGSTD